jgi:hypothetical protein
MSLDQLRRVVANDRLRKASPSEDCREARRLRVDTLAGLLLEELEASPPGELEYVHEGCSILLRKTGPGEEPGSLSRVKIEV